MNVIQESAYIGLIYRAEGENGTELQQGQDTGYCFHYYLPITHSADNNRNHEHSHTIELATYVKPVSEESLQKFEKIEAYAANALKRYDGRYLNDLPEFGGDASIEHVGDTLYEILSGMLEQNGVELTRLEIGENPLRTYIISSYI